MIDARLSVALPSHPKTKKLIKRLGQAAAWNFVCLVLWTAANRSEGSLSGMSVEDIELASDWSGDDGVFVSTLKDVGFIHSSNDCLQLDMEMFKFGKPPISKFGRVCSKKWRKIRLSIFERDGFSCAYCGKSDGPLECDHIVPISRGGSNETSNLVTACMKCNRSKKAKLVSEWRSV